MRARVSRELCLDASESVLTERLTAIQVALFGVPDSGKGRQLKFCHQHTAIAGNGNEIGDVGPCPRKSFLFFLTVRNSMKAVYPEIWY